MPLFSSLSTRDSTSAHHNKLEKSAHRRASVTSGRKGSLRKPQVDEDASTKAIAGSASRLNQSNADANETATAPPLTPKSIRNDNYDEEELNNMTTHNLPPTPPAHDDPFARGVGGGYIVEDGTQAKDGSVRSSSTWREHRPDAVAMKNKSTLHATTTAQDNPHATTSSPRAHPLGPGAGAGVAGLGSSSRAYGMDDQGGDWTSDEQHHGHDFVAGGGERAIDLATARKKIQFAIEAELAADRALELARHAVHEARAAVKTLEKQMNEEFQRAQARKAETEGVVKELEKLGRHDHRA